MDARTVRCAARSLLFMVLFAVAFLSPIPSKDVSAHDALAPHALPRSQMDIPGPTGSVNFGKTVTVLPNGNFVVTDPAFGEGGATNLGAVYLYSGATRTIISTLKGQKTDDYVGGA